MINRGYASGQANARDSNDQAFGANVAPATGTNVNINNVSSAVATLLGEELESRDNTREMLMNLVRQEQIENEDQSFESDNQWLSRSEQSSPSSSSPSAAQLRVRSPVDNQAILPRSSYFAAGVPTPVI